ncbi:Aspartate-semialdehyde dehydrogenase [bioreactor metagenome]|uniref:Aspartate-semialdehyde dehydrogenase n=1 Tax=bioreactor metagenome TaxID=1076179 RepID=A0A645CZ86_9ZZZZ
MVPEVNPESLNCHSGLIANPNCSTIQLVAPLHVISNNNTIKRVVVSTYQAISGAGQKGLEKLRSESIGVPNTDKYKIFNSVMFHSEFNEQGNTVEEEKMINETRKILDISSFKMAVTCVRVPVENSHCISANVEFANNIDIDEIKQSLASAPGIKFIDDSTNEYPTPLMSNGSDDVFVGRVRKDNSVENAISLWIVADNLRKGAASNAVEIAEYILDKDIFHYQISEL